MPTFYPSNPELLQPLAYLPLPLGAIQPQGWLLDQLRAQANGLTGHLEEFWPDLGPRNMWLGGDLEGWERGPYYLDGLIPLAFLLEDERLKAMAQRWIESILSLQSEDGWIGPIQAPDRQPYDIWPMMIVLKILTQYHEATGDDRALDAVRLFCEWLRDHLDAHPLFEWGHYRWADLVVSVDWLHRRAPEPWLPELARKIQSQGYDWTSHFLDFAFKEKRKREECILKTHVVNNAMAIKTSGIEWEHSGDERDRRAVYAAFENLDRYHGQVTGVFTGDEHYAGKEPTQGTELCAVVEMMYSLEVLLSLLGDPAFGDRLEKIAYNALPAATTADLWAHQYDQQVNQVLCTVAPRAWTNNDDTSNIFGLEPNYGCCTANMHQGWPKLASHLWMATPDGGLAAMAYAPCVVSARVGDGAAVALRVETEYPFRETIRVTVESQYPVQFPLLLRIPEWATEARISINGQAEKPESGAFHRVERVWNPGDQLELTLPMALRTEERLRGAVSVLRGPLVFALKIPETWKQIGGERPHADWEIHPAADWNLALELDPATPESALSVEESPLSSLPFDTDQPPVALKGHGRRLPDWMMADNSAGPTPQSPVAASQPLEEVELIPYGSTQLRIAEIPWCEVDIPLSV